MKHKKALFILFLISLVSFSCFSQEAEIKAELKSTIEKMFVLINDSNHIELCQYIIYVNYQVYDDYQNDERSRKDCLNPDNESELKLAKDIGLDIQSSYLKYDNYSFVEFLSQEKSDGRILYAWQMEFNANKETINAIFAFMKINGKYVLVDID